jgi:hypothetical protein
VIPVALIYHWLFLHWPSGAGPGVGVLGILIAIVAHRRAARAYRDLAMVRYDALSEMSGQLSFSSRCSTRSATAWCSARSTGGRRPAPTRRSSGRARAAPARAGIMWAMRVSETYWRA